MKTGIKRSIGYQPNLWIRLTCWFAVYFAASSLYGLGISVWPRDIAALLLYGALHFPETLQLFIVGSLGLPHYSDYYKSVRVFAYACFVLNFILALTVSGKRVFWALIFLLIVLIFLGIYGTSCYCSTVFEVIPNPQTH